MKTTIVLPDPLSFQQLRKWSEDLWRPSNELEIRIDFQNVRFLTAFAMMLIVQYLEDYKKKFPASIIIIQNHEHLGIARRMGFWASINDIVIGGQRKEETDPFPQADEIFLPITKIITSDFKKPFGRDLIAINEAVDREAESLAKTLTHFGSGYIFDSIQYAMREIIRNVFEHSGASCLRYCATFYVKTKRVEMIIADNGMGIYYSLIGNKTFKSIQERDALHFACLPGISGNEKAMKERNTGNPWSNSGYGLFMTSRMCRDHGDFTIISSNHALVLKPDGKTDFRIKNTTGTLIRLHLDLNRSGSFRRDLELYSQEGLKQSETIRGAKVLEASVASQMLRRDFNKQT
jgi:hypothetical protein